jgi:hypothetical protein
MKKPILFLISLLITIPCIAAQITVNWNGSADYLTIQDGIDASIDGDTVIIAQGTYTGPRNRDLDFGGRAITVRSIDPNDPNIVAATIVDCNATETDHHRGFIFRSGEGAHSVLAGLTITNGNMGGGAGGGIYCERSSPTVSRCIVTGNWAFSGGGIACLGGSSTISRCTISGNACGSLGGGVWSRSWSYARLANCIISGNSAERGGGISCWEGNTTEINNCTIAGNFASFSGGGIDSYSSYSLPAVSGCILWGNDAVKGPEISVRFSSSVTVSYSDVQGGQAAAYFEYGGTLTWGPGNIDVEPLFWDAAAGDYHLLPNSPCIDSGDPSYVPRAWETDIDGDQRIIGGRIDIGADEVCAAETPILVVSPRGFEFNGVGGGLNPEAQILSISNLGIGTFSWEIMEDCGWLEVDSNRGECSSGAEPCEVTVSADISGLEPGLYNFEMRVTANEASNSPLRIAVKLAFRVDGLLDFGDCPDPRYPTLLFSDGARHIIDPNVFLGSGIDSESDGQPTLWADGDDVNGIPDEDGISFTSVLFDYCTRDVNVVASCEGKLDAWFDFNADADWSDPDEQIFASEPLNAGSNILTFNIPSDAATGETYARFRFSTAGGLETNGPAPDGEVEDYMVSILPDCISPGWIWPPRQEYVDWVEWNKPECWCYPRQCHGDADGIKSGPFWVAIPDLNILRSAINKMDTVLATIPNSICADFDHTKMGPFRVNIADLNIFRLYFNKPESQVPDCFDIIIPY